MKKFFIMMLFVFLGGIAKAQSTMEIPISKIAYGKFNITTKLYSFGAQTPVKDSKLLSVFQKDGKHTLTIFLQDSGIFLVYKELVFSRYEGEDFVVKYKVENHNLDQADLVTRVHKDGSSTYFLFIGDDAVVYYCRPVKNNS